MALSREQCGKRKGHYQGTSAKWLKKFTARWWRRQARRDPEAAPVRRPTRSWWW